MHRRQQNPESVSDSDAQIRVSPMNLLLQAYTTNDAKLSVQKTLFSAHFFTTREFKSSSTPSAVNEIKTIKVFHINCQLNVFLSAMHANENLWFAAAERGFSK
jgi:hypothetical protein